MFAIVSITTAAVIYSIAVFAEFRSHNLKGWHLALFWAGLVFDTIGTTLMSKIAGGFELNVHGVLGLAAIIIMFVHAGWASIVLSFKLDRFKRNFHRFSVTAWSLWMVSLVTGFAIAIPPMMK